MLSFSNHDVKCLALIVLFFSAVALIYKYPFICLKRKPS